MLQLAIPADRAEVKAIAKQVHDLHVAWRPDIYASVVELYTEERFLEAIKNRQLYVAKEAGTVIGFASLQRCTYDWPGVVKRRAMIVEDFGVHKMCQGHGIGKAMMEDIHALARAFGCSDLQLKVYPQNDAAIGFYQKCGFRIRTINMDMKL